MIDIKKEMEVFIITNGRSSFQYVKKSIDNQKNVLFNYNIVENLNWIDACNECLHFSNIPFYLRVDDDMILHPLAVSYYYYLIKNQNTSNSIIINCKLWDFSRNQTISSLKLYNRSLTKNIGFEIDERGKVDRIFKKKSNSKKYIYGGDKYSIVGIHASCPIEENMKYAYLRGEDKSKDFNLKLEHFLSSSKYLKNHDLKYQSDISENSIFSKNIEYNTNFSKFINGELK